MGDSSDSEMDAATTVLNLRPRAGKILRDQRLRQQRPSPEFRVEWKNEVDGSQDGRGEQQEPSTLPQPSIGFRQPLLTRPRFGTLSREDLTADHGSARPTPPPRLVRQASQGERQRNKPENQLYWTYKKRTSGNKPWMYWIKILNYLIRLWGPLKKKWI